MREKVNGNQLYYTKLGKGQPLLLLHGHHLDGGMFDKVAAPLSLYYTVYVLDMRGHGLSQGDVAEHYQTEVEDVASFIKQVGIEGCFCFGFDAGGLVAMMLASQQPQIFAKLMIAGVFVNGNGISPYHYLTEGFLRFLRLDRDSQVELTESFMSVDSLRAITIPTYCIVGEKDWVKVEHVRWYSQLIPQGQLIVMPRQTHDSYAVKSFKLLNLMEEFFK
ncbi:alpha/beta hydrolase [Lactobacillus sp. ESL0684]|uniref:alpha/beta fold hydrolase n=1 Tax=unclassified Lactobacillus TaxID=2620435 RepID=UPI0023F9EEB7|nr:MULTISPECIES: alpha/beta hydrolase [unclassified Lactobacillus]WEV39917.1 alpha/beta hydrolase [Lactobacillus sp. ESL0681]WEV43535.1 alpha/beta hydrolase [Lactobacillus sp. ESL0684]